MPSQEARTIVRGRSASASGDVPVTVALEAEGFSVAVGDSAPWWAAYRDVMSVRADAGSVEVGIGAGHGGRLLKVGQLGPAVGTLVRGLRDGRTRQWLSDGLVELDADALPELVEFAAGPIGGVASILYHARGVALAPVDEQLPRFNVRRAEIGAVTGDPAAGTIRVEGPPGEAGGRTLARGRAVGGAPNAEAAVDALEFRGLGGLAERHRQRWAAVRDSAAADIAAILAARLADAPFDVRRGIGGVLREGQPSELTALGDGGPVLEAAVLADPGFAASYRTLVDRAGGPAAPRWIALAPVRPGNPDEVQIWFLVPLPGNLVALELVSAGAHATYLYRVAPRADYDPSGARPANFATAVREVSEALMDSRFLREPMALPAERLAEPRYLGYRLALAALPSLAAARARFVARLVHADPASWAAALDDLIGWHGAERDEAAAWPGRAAMEAEIEAAEAPPGAPPGAPSD